MTITNKTEKKGEVLTAVLQKWRFSASYDSEVVNQNLVLRLKFSGENRHLCKARNRCAAVPSYARHCGATEKHLCRAGIVALSFPHAQKPIESTKIST